MTTTTWIAIADGTKAQVFENTGPGEGMHRLSDLDFSIAALQSKDIASDRPGRSFSSEGPGRSAMEPPTDPAEHREAEFVREFAEELDRKAKAGAYDKLVIASAPSALGNLRKFMSDHVKDRVIAEIDKDLTNVPEPKLGKHFQDIVKL